MELLKESRELSLHHVAEFHREWKPGREVLPRGSMFILGYDLDVDSSNVNGRFGGLWAFRTTEPFVFRAGRLLYAVDSLGHRLPGLLTRIDSEKGVLSYINGCSNSEVIPPPRNGDPCLNLMYMPCGVDQTWHVHPSMRLGAVTHGRGVSEWKERNTRRSHTLAPGDVFLIPPMEEHHFKTEDSELTVVIFHPDSDGGPLDHKNPMVTRTYI